VTNCIVSVQKWALAPATRARWHLAASCGRQQTPRIHGKFGTATLSAENRSPSSVRRRTPQGRVFRKSDRKNWFAIATASRRRTWAWSRSGSRTSTAAIVLGLTTTEEQPLSRHKTVMAQMVFIVSHALCRLPPSDTRFRALTAFCYLTAAGPRRSRESGPDRADRRRDAGGPCSIAAAPRGPGRRSGRFCWCPRRHRGDWHPG
jgi:hypothetical protein